MKRPLSGAALVAATMFGNLFYASAVQAAIQGQAGPYQIEVSSDPATIPVGPAKLVIKVTAAGKPIDGAQVTAIAQMPGMPMGEREEAAVPQAGQPGVYVVPVQFAMAGAYEATVSVKASQGVATAKILLKTGQNTGGLSTPGGVPGSASSASLWPMLPWVLGGALLVFILYRMRKTGQRINPRSLLNVRTLAGIALLVIVYLISVWAVKKYTKPGHMSVIEAQAMDMTVMKPPVGAVPVAAMAAKSEPMESTVRYSGSAVAYVDVDVTPRVTGTIASMPLYPGDKVRKGQVVARLDTRELSSRVGEQTANVSMAEHASEIARMQAQQARNQTSQSRAMIDEARSDVTNAESDLAAAQQDVDALLQERAAAVADVDSAQSGVTDALAQLASAQADETYWRAQIKRSESLVKTGAISQQEYQQDRAQAENATSKVRAAQAKVQQAKSGVVAAQSRIGKMDGMIASARSKVSGMQAKVRAARSKVVQSQDAALAQSSAAAAAEHQIEHSQAGIRQAQSQLNTARLVAGYTEIRAELDGVVTERLISPGVLVQPGQPILRISQESPVRLQANVAASDLASVHVGNRVRITNARDPQHPISARVSSVFPSADPVARTSVVEALYPNGDHRFVPGDFITMDITTGENQSAIVVPASSIVWQAQATSPVLATSQQPSVWVIQSGTPEKTVYTCTMHPEVKEDKPGKCPT